MRSGKIKGASITSIVFNILCAVGYALLWLVLILTVGLAKGFGGDGVDFNGLDIVMYLCMLLIPICVAALIMAIVVLVNSNKNAKKFVIILVLILILKTILNVINILVVLDKLSIIFAVVALVDIICITLLLLGCKKRKIEIPENIENEPLSTTTQNE